MSSMPTNTDAVARRPAMLLRPHLGRSNPHHILEYDNSDMQALIIVSNQLRQRE